SRSCPPSCPSGGTGEYFAKQLPGVAVRHCGSVASFTKAAEMMPVDSLYGAFFVKEFREGGASSFLRRFLCSIWKPVSSSRPALRSRRRAQELSRLAVAPTLQHS